MNVIEIIPQQGIMVCTSVFQKAGPDPLLGLGHLLLGSQNLCFVLHGSPNCVLFCFMGCRLTNMGLHPTPEKSSRLYLAQWMPIK
jgi:hypothetical protein